MEKLTPEQALMKYEDIINRLSYIHKVEGYDHDDLAQEFRMILVSCLANFDSERGTTFNTYFTRSCENRVKRLRRGQEWTVSLNNDAGETIEFLDLLESKELDPYEFTQRQEMLEFINQELDSYKYGYVTRDFLLYGLTQIEIAQSTGLSTSYINKIHNKNMADLRKAANKKFQK